MTKTMMFIDGSWLYWAMRTLGDNYAIDYAGLPEILMQATAERFELTDIDLIRKFYFGSFPDNYSPEDENVARTQYDFLDRLRRDFRYELEVFPMDFHGQRIRMRDRNPDDEFKVKEKCVDVALATRMLFYAMTPGAYDIAVVVIGDKDYLPVLQQVRRMGKRVVIASIKGSCAQEYDDPFDKAGVKDSDIVWLNDYADTLEYTPEAVRNGSAPTPAPKTVLPDIQVGVIWRIDRHSNDPHGVIRTQNGKEYRFNVHSLRDTTWENLTQYQHVQFYVDTEPSGDNPGVAASVWMTAQKRESS